MRRSVNEYKSGRTYDRERRGDGGDVGRKCERVSVWSECNKELLPRRRRKMRRRASEYKSRK